MNIFLGPKEYYLDYPKRGCSRRYSRNREWYGGYHYFGSLEYYEFSRDKNPFCGDADTIEIVKSSLFKKGKQYEFKRYEGNTVVTKVLEFVCYQMVEKKIDRTRCERQCYALFRSPQKPEKGDFEKIKLGMEYTNLDPESSYGIWRWVVDYGDFFDIKPINSTI